VRHTAQAVLATIQFRGLQYWTIQATERLLTCEQHGGWPNELRGEEVKLFSTLFVSELLYTLETEDFRTQLASLGRKDLSPRIRAACQRSHGWFLEKSRDRKGWGSSSFNTATVLYRIGKHLLSDFPELVQFASDRLWEMADGNTWTDEQQTAPVSASSQGLRPPRE